MIFHKQGAENMRKEFDKLLQDTLNPLKEREIIEIKDCIKNKDKELTKHILKETIPLYPESPNLPWNFAKISMKEDKYEIALQYFKIAIEREFFNIPWINRDIEKCKNKLKEHD